MRQVGLTGEEARQRIAMVDSHGLVTQGRRGLEPFKAAFTRTAGEIASYVCHDRSRISMREAIANFRPSVLLGASGTRGLFTEPIVRLIAALHERPIIFPLSNPTSNSECSAEEAIVWSNGRAIVATESPFPPVTFGQLSYRIGQG